MDAHACSSFIAGSSSRLVIEERIGESVLREQS
jgi:hypothetical protein